MSMCGVSGFRTKRVFVAHEAMHERDARNRGMTHRDSGVTPTAQVAPYIPAIAPTSRIRSFLRFQPALIYSLGASISGTGRGPFTDASEIHPSHGAAELESAFFNIQQANLSLLQVSFPFTSSNLPSSWSRNATRSSPPFAGISLGHCDCYCPANTTCKNPWDGA